MMMNDDGGGGGDGDGVMMMVVVVVVMVMVMLFETCLHLIPISRILKPVDGGS
jgi:hypothetical protein